MTDQIAGQTVTTDLDAQANAGTTRQLLNPVTQRIVERAIQEVLGEYVKSSKQFTADSLHGIRVKVTELVKQRLGEDEIATIDIGLDLGVINEIPFFFNVIVPDTKKPIHFIEVPVEEFERIQAAAQAAAQAKAQEAQTPEIRTVDGVVDQKPL